MGGTTEAAQTVAKRFSKDRTELQKQRKLNKKENTVNTLRLAFERSVKAADSQSTAIWRHTKEEGYLYEDEWVFDSSYSDIKYDNKGNRISEIYTDWEGFESLYTYTNDENGQRTSQYCEVIDELNGNIPYSKGAYEWDPIVTDFCLLKQNWDYVSGSWSENATNYKRTVTRNEAGNVTSVVVSMYYLGSYEDIERTDIAYNETTGKAETYTFSRLSVNMNGELVWIVQQEVKELEWENTDGQLVREWQSFLQGNNRVKSGAVYYNGKLDGYQNVTYVEGKTDFVSEETDISGNVWVRTKYTTLDENGSYRIDVDEFYWEDGEVADTYSYYDKVQYNDKGDAILHEYFEVIDGEESLVSGEKNTYTYDTETGIILEAATDLCEDEEEGYLPFFKIVYSDPVDASKQSGIENIAIDENAPVEYYNLQGVRVSNPENGIFIKKQAGKATKVIL